MADNLTVKLGADTSEFRGQIAAASQSLGGLKGTFADVEKSIEHLNQSTGRLQHRLLEGFIGFEAIMRLKEWALEAVKDAQKVRTELEELHKPIDMGTRALAEFGDGLEAVKAGAVKSVGFLVSGWALIGQEIGHAINSLRGFSEAEQNINEATGRAADEQEKRRDEAIKRHANDAEKAAEMEKQNAEQEYKNAELKKTLEVQAVDAILHKKKLEQEYANIVTDTDTARLLRAEKQKQIDQADAEIQKLHNELVKQGEEESKKAAEAIKKIGEEDLAWYKKREAAEKELHDLKLAALPPEEKLIQLQKEQAALTEKIKKGKRDGVDTIEDEIKSLKLAKDVEEATLAIIKEETKEKKEQAKLITKAPTYDAGVMKIASGFATYNNAAQQKEYEANLIASAKADIQEEIDTIQSQIDAYMRSGSGLGRYEIPALQERIKALRGRQNNVQDYVFNPNYADAAGKGIFANQVSTIGDPLKLQTAQTDILKQVNGGVTELNTRLRMAGFGTGT